MFKDPTVIGGGIASARPCPRCGAPSEVIDLAGTMIKCDVHGILPVDEAKKSGIGFTNDSTGQRGNA